MTAAMVLPIILREVSATRLQVVLLSKLVTQFSFSLELTQNKSHKENPATVQTAILLWKPTAMSGSLIPIPREVRSRSGQFNHMVSPIGISMGSQSKTRLGQGLRCTMQKILELRIITPHKPDHLALLYCPVLTMVVTMRRWQFKYQSVEQHNWPSKLSLLRRDN